MSSEAKIPGTDLRPFGLCLGGNVFGWTADAPTSFAVLDAYLAAGGNFLDTADQYSAWVAGNHGGESESIIGEWMDRRGARDRVIVATKVGSAPGLDNLRADTIKAACDASLQRLRTDRIDLYYAHRDDPATDQAETLGAFAELVEAGKVRYVGASNFSAARLESALALAGSGPARYVALQPNYNLMSRRAYEGELAELCARSGVACVPYYALASGFLTGKYRPGGPQVDSVRASGASRYLDARGEAVLAELDSLAAEHGVPVAAVAIAWLRQQPTVVSPIASARSTEQLAELLASASLELSAEELARLGAASTEEGTA